ncbi:uncharacterized protein FIBRA_04290 [Fibroporia radiculosa]|uniref:ATP-dependent DNA helicase n=1 Tax=Fibroporia radiculosa TaxID=599839 RepID=J4GP10_9APHY|nr:uncharacterized protein FIBRA_04290 [Fibroporia radiculosa]CCM02210.1 predicted protein [Fibroporia radiculosa]
MHSDDYFEDELDSAFLHEFDAVEAAHVLPSKSSPLKATRQLPATTSTVIEILDSDPFDAFDFDVADLQVIDEIQKREGPCGQNQTAAGPSNSSWRRTTSKGAVQTTLFGDIVDETATASKGSKPPSRAPMVRTNSGSRNLFGGRAKKTKQWDHSAFAKSGWKQSAAEKRNAKGKQRMSFDDDDDDDDNIEEEILEFEQFPAPFVPLGPVGCTPSPMKLQPDLLASKRWLYPLNQPKRDYQFNIVKNSLYENTLVALPTGLGKTFIAGVVMLNFYSWFPEGKVIFLAPSKPLVAQQIEACHQTCGIPGAQAAELTGETPKSKRLKLWAEKRVFYMTPQTLLSDLISANCDPRDIILIVIDEAHKGTGDYAYAQVIRFMMAKNPHFRVLALTATPGGNPEAVQAIVDCLHISHIEIRDENSLDLRPYLHKKASEQHIIKMDEDVVKVRDLLAKIMQPLIRQVQNSGAMRGSSDPTMLHPFRCQSASQELRQRKAPAWALAAAAKLGPLARAMGYLLEASMGMCYTVISGIVYGFDGTTGKKSTSRAAQSGLQKDSAFGVLLKEIEAQKNRGFSLHPKMEKLRILLIQHFANHMFDNEDTGRASGNSHPATQSRVMVFVSFRECVDEVVEVLNREEPLIKATRFIGQGTDKQGRKGIGQREQLEVIKKFKSGEFNVLVSTSIGEEGLDIGEIDMIVCYDAQKTPIRMLQRIGRTGRKKDGIVHILLAEGREERNWDKAQDKYKDVQHFIVRAEELELYGDTPRLLPDHIKPECTEMIMDIEAYIREDRPSRKGSIANGDDSPLSKARKRKRDDDPKRNIPSGASTGFVNVKDLLVKGGATKKQKKCKLEEPDALAGEDDEEDMEIEAGLFGPRRTVSTSSIPVTSKAKKPKRTKTIATAGKSEHTTKTKKRKQKLPIEPSASDLERMGADDSDDAAIERGITYPDSLSKSIHDKFSLHTLESHSSPSPLLQLQKTDRLVSNNEVIDLTYDTTYRQDSPALSFSSSPDEAPKSRNTDVYSRSASTRSRSIDTKSRGTSVQHEDGSSNPPERSTTPSSRSTSLHHHHEESDMAWLVDDDDDDDPSFQILHSSPSNGQDVSRKRQSIADHNVLPVEETNFLELPARNVSSTPVRTKITPSGFIRATDAMPPPALPARLTASSPSIFDDALPQPSFAVRAPGKQVRKRIVTISIDSSPSAPLAMPPMSQRRLQTKRNSSPDVQPSPPKRKKRKFKDVAEAQKANPWIDVEATHSGDDNSLGSSDVDRGDEYDRDFVRDTPETQASPSYDQSAVYRRSLFTQAPGGASVPDFAGRPVRRGWGAYARGRTLNSRPGLSSSPRYEDEDDYEFGSFVVKDDEEIEFAGHASSDL